MRSNQNHKIWKKKTNFTNNISQNTLKKPEIIQKKPEIHEIHEEKIITENDEEECYYGIENETRNSDLQTKMSEKMEEKKNQGEPEELKKEIKPKISEKSLTNSQNSTKNNENISPSEAKYEIVKKKRKVKKTVEEMNAKGQLSKSTHTNRE